MKTREMINLEERVDSHDAGVLAPVVDGRPDDEAGAGEAAADNNHPKEFLQESGRGA